jgi:lipopolysaccharide/colanic/teichoic acid biosynthesis glycosyltransferase
MAFIEKNIQVTAREIVVAATGKIAPPHRARDFRPGLAQGASGRTAYRQVFKRAIDVALVVLAMPFWVPLVLIGAAFVMLDGHRPFYSQERIGRNGRVFRMWKLRSMVRDADACLESHLAADPAARAEWDATQKLKNDPRITAVGRILRKTSLDELPQLFNVLTGDMSLVGPRPIMVSQKRLYPGRSYYRMRPGLTGLWQVSDRNECSFVERVRFDDTYHGMMSFRADAKILLRTVSVVMRGTGY